MVLSSSFERIVNFQDEIIFKMKNVNFYPTRWLIIAFNWIESIMDPILFRISYLIR